MRKRRLRLWVGLLVVLAMAVLMTGVRMSRPSVTDAPAEVRQGPTELPAAFTYRGSGRAGYRLLVRAPAARETWFSHLRRWFGL